MDADADGDGNTNQHEYLAGTNPTSSGSSLKISAIVPAGNNMSMSFPSVPDKTYRLEATANLGNPGSWQILQENIPGTGNTVSVIEVDGLLHAIRFYRIVVE